MQGEHPFKWSGKSIGIDESVAQAAFAMVERTFTKQWLEKGLTNRIQETWARNDFLAALELYALGDSIQTLHALNPKKLSELVRIIRKGGSESHGFLYEIHALAMLASSGCPVEPTFKAEPGFDARLTHPSGTQIRWSFKNHDITDAERTFRRFGADLYGRFRQRCRPGALERLIVHAERHLKPADFAEIGRALDGVWSGEAVIAAGDVVVSWRRLGAPPDQAPYAADRLSTQLTVVCKHPELEQVRFRQKLSHAVENMQKHCPPADGQANAILMRLHASADVLLMLQDARSVVDDPASGVDAVFFHQPSVVRTAGTIELLHYMTGTISPRYPQSVGLTFQMPVGKFSTMPSGLGFSRDGVFTPLEGSYQYQAGDVVREATASPTGFEAHTGSPAAGIRQSVIFPIQGQRLELLGRFAPSDELLLI